MIGKKCLVCEKLIVGRSDKKFCSETCRSRYYYSVNKEYNILKSKVHDLLRRNREILAELNPSGKCTVDVRELLDRKFNFNFFTTIYRTNGGNVYWFCYDYGFRKLEKGKSYQLVKWQNYMEKYTLMKTDNS